MTNLRRERRMLDLYGQHGLGVMSIQEATRETLERIYPPRRNPNWVSGIWTGTLGEQDITPMELAERIEESFLYGPDLGPYTRARVEAALDPVAFWCRFCRVTLEPFAHA